MVSQNVFLFQVLKAHSTERRAVTSIEQYVKENWTAANELLRLVIPACYVFSL